MIKKTNKRNGILIILFLIATFANAQDFNSYLAAGQKAFDSRMYRTAYDNATKAIELNATSSEARWLRVRSSLTANAPIERLSTAVDDLNVLSKTEQTGEVYKMLGTTESELGIYISHFKQTEPNYKEKALGHFEKSKTAFNKAKELSPDLASNINYEIAAVNLMVSDLKKSDD